MTNVVPLSELEVNQHGYIVRLCEDCPSLMKKKLLAVGFVKGSTLRVVRKTPLGSPIEIELMGTRFCLRKTEAQCVFVVPG
jgi:Fe2+ transport system protein FeoA